MMLRTHFVVGLATALYFLPHIRNKFIFMIVILFASVLPDVDTAFSTIGKRKIFRPIQWVTKHRGLTHTYTLCLFITLIFILFSPILALPFFTGYSFHLYMDAYTVRGIKPFWPLKKTWTGNITTGGKVDSTIFYISAFVSFGLFIKLFL